jgi:hypothetical protein
MAEKNIRISGAWIGRKVEVSFYDYSHPGATVFVSLPGKLLNVQDEGIIFAKELHSGSTDEQLAPPRFYPWDSMSDVQLSEEQES